MENEVNRALMAKKNYVHPQVEVAQVNLKTGVLALTSAGGPRPAPHRNDEVW